MHACGTRNFSSRGRWSHAGGAHGPQAGDALLGGGVGAEHAGHAGAAAALQLVQRIVDVGLCLGGATTIGVRAASISMRSSAFGQSVAAAEQFGGTAVGLELARAADRHLDERRGDGREQRHQQHRHRVGAVLVVAAAAEHAGEHRHLGDVADCRGDGRGHRADEDVAVLHVHQLVGHHALDLVARHRLEQARWWRTRRRASGRGRWRTRWAGRSARWPPAASAGWPAGRARRPCRRTRGVVALDHLGLGRGEGQLVAEPVRAADHHEGEAEADGECGAAAAAENAGDGDDEAAQSCEQHGGLHGVLEHRDVSVLSRSV